MSVEPIKTIEFDSIAEIFSFFSPLSKDKRKAGLDLKQFIFRGHSDSSYQLLPTALRADGPHKIWRASLTEANVEESMVVDSSVMFKTLSTQIAMEYMVIRNFFKLADQQGLALPSHEQLRRNLANSVDFNGHFACYPESWIPENLLEITALAQHYGLPTRLLDWTYDRYVAMYFALSGITTWEGKATIWALNREYISGLKYTPEQTAIDFVTPSYFGNPNLNAQKGIFTHIPVLPMQPIPNCTGAGIPPQIIERKPLEENVLEIFKGQNETVLLKLNFPKSHLYVGLGALNELGYGAAKLFPGYQGVADQIQQTGVRLAEKNKLLTSGSRQ